MAAQLMATNGFRLRVESLCKASATSSLPDPVGPSINTGVERGATRRMRLLISSMQAEFPINSGILSLPAVSPGLFTLRSSVAIAGTFVCEPWSTTGRSVVERRIA